MGGGGDVRNEPVPKPSKLGGGGENLTVQGHRRRARGGRGVSLNRGPPVDKFCLGHGEVDLPGVGNGANASKGGLERAGVGTIRGGGGSKGKVVHIGEDQAVGEGNMKWSNVDNKQKRGNRGALGSAHRNGGKDHGGALKKEAAGAVGQEGANPRDHVVGYTFVAKGGAEDVDIDVVESAFNVEKQGGNLAARPLEGAHCVDKGSASVKRGEGG